MKRQYSIQMYYEKTMLDAIEPWKVFIWILKHAGF